MIIENKIYKEFLLERAWHGAGPVSQTHFVVLIGRALAASVRSLLALTSSASVPVGWLSSGNGQLHPPNSFMELFLSCL